jgi:hypothetical protein
MKIVQCWDDAVEDDIRLIEILRNYNAKASFNLNPASHKAKRSGQYNEKWGKTILRLAKGELLSVYDGFTIANHSMTHPWPTRISIKQWTSEVVDARKALQDMFQQPINGFAYPFGEANQAVADVVRNAGHCYGRMVAPQTPCLPQADPLRFNPDCHFKSPDFWDRYEKAKASTAGAFYFWGHSFELKTEADWDAFNRQIERIHADSDTEWEEVEDLFKSPPASKNV